MFIILDIELINTIIKNMELSKIKTFKFKTPKKNEEYPFLIIENLNSVSQRVSKFYNFEKITIRMSIYSYANNIGDSYDILNNVLNNLRDINKTKGYIIQFDERSLKKQTVVDTSTSDELIRHILDVSYINTTYKK